MGPTAGGQTDELLRLLRRARPDLELGEEDAAYLGQRLASAREAWPELGGEGGGAAQAIAHLAPHLGGAPLAAAIGELHVEDLVLAGAAARGDAGALAAVDRLCAAAVEKAARSVRGSDAVSDELLQRIRVRVMGPREPDASGAPAIASYAGACSLAGWLRVIAVREAIKLVSRRREVPVSDELLASALAPDAGPELAYMKRLYRAEFGRAFSAALASLSPRQRTLLRQHALDELGLDRMARLYGAHRATVARWLAAARADLVAATRRELVERLGISPVEVDSILRLVESQLDVSLGGLRGRARRTARS
ncbi:MAG TPA: sigma-70 family RNA polymerase sigma factor [Kofleriaceae bacterium]|nr:sigma-70 family RNA polymerase sigma factor [Kofleriaceae bacterium]